MKKALYCLACLLFCAVCLTVFVGCGSSSDKAENVRNKIYTQSLYQEDLENKDTGVSLTLRFFDDSFKVEATGATFNGNYIGTYEIAENKLNLTITDYFGDFETHKTETATKKMLFKTLTYKKGKISTQFFVEDKMQQYTFTEKTAQ